MSKKSNFGLGFLAICEMVSKYLIYIAALDSNISAASLISFAASTSL